MTMGLSVVLRPAAQAGMRALRAWIPELEPTPSGMTRSTYAVSFPFSQNFSVKHTMIFILGFAALMI